ncbi:MAG TPA: YciI family protein, partial [Gillisia sp.]|nr:YciI family protein [Gillisia sp.]
TFIYKEGDSTYLMQQYYMVFLKSGEKRSQDSTEAAQLQAKHLSHLERMEVEGYASLIGPFEDDSDVRGIVVYNTKTLKEADSLANMDPMVKAGRLKVEVHPWWTQKGGKLK